jgi:hypothetical protein
LYVVATVGDVGAWKRPVASIVAPVPSTDHTTTPGSNWPLVSFAMNWNVPPHKILAAEFSVMLGIGYTVAFAGPAATVACFSELLFGSHMGHAAPVGQGHIAAVAVFVTSVTVASKYAGSIRKVVVHNTDSPGCNVRSDVAFHPQFKIIGPNLLLLPRTTESVITGFVTFGEGFVVFDAASKKSGGFVTLKV